MIFARKIRLLKTAPHIIGSFLFFIASLILASFITIKCDANTKSIIECNVFSNVLDIFNNVEGGYLKINLIPLFTSKNPFGGGVVGYGILSLIYPLSEAVTITIITFVYLASLILIFIRSIIKLVNKIRNLKNNKSSEPTSKTKEKKKPKIDDIDLAEEDDLSNIRPIEDNLRANLIPGAISPVSFDDDFDDDLPFMGKNPATERSTFEKTAYFVNEDNKDDELKNFTNSSPSIDNIKNQIEPQNVEQLQLEFEEAPVIPPAPPIVNKPTPSFDKEVVMKQPEFANPIPINREESVISKPVEKIKPKLVWIPPSSNLLNSYESHEAEDLNNSTAEQRQNLINEIFANFGVGANVSGFTVGPSVTRYHVEYGTSVSVKQVNNIVQDISVRLGGLFTRFEPVVEGFSFSGLEIPNAKTTTVGFKEVFDALPPIKENPTYVPFGKAISGKIVSADLLEFPHLLVAGTTGSGKSIYVHSIICTLIMRLSPEQLKIVLVDPKKVEMTKYRDMPHLLCPIITEASKAKVMLSKLCDEMEDRYTKFGDADGASKLSEYNEWAEEHNQPILPYIVCFLDEYADLFDTCKEIAQPVQSIAQKARAAGIHLVVATQRPSTNVITGVIKGNLNTRVALATASYTDSSVIIGEGGAEKLLGKGDMLVQSPLISRNGVVRLQGCYISNKEIVRIVSYLKEHYEPDYDPNYLDLVEHGMEVGKQMVGIGEVGPMPAEAEARYQSIKEWVLSLEYVSMSKIQRDCSVGFNRAGQFLNRLQQEGIVSTTSEGGNKGFRVLGEDRFNDDYSTPVGSDELTSYGSER